MGIKVRLAMAGGPRVPGAVGKPIYLFPLGFPLCTRKDSGIHIAKDLRRLGSKPAEV